MAEFVNVYVELLDEGVETWRPTKAVSLGNDLFKLLEPEGYDPEDEFWEFLPGTTVKLEQSTFYTGLEGLLAKHPDPKAVRIFVESSEQHAPQIRQTHALKLDNGLYKVLPTPHYTPAQLWRFPPGTPVSLEKSGSGRWSYLIAVKAFPIVEQNEHR